MWWKDFVRLSLAWKWSRVMTKPSYFFQRASAQGPDKLLTHKITIKLQTLSSSDGISSWIQGVCRWSCSGENNNYRNTFVLVCIWAKMQNKNKTAITFLINNNNNNNNNNHHHHPKADGGERTFSSTFKAVCAARGSGRSCFREEKPMMMMMLMFVFARDVLWLQWILKMV